MLSKVIFYRVLIKVAAQEVQVSRVVVREDVFHQINERTNYNANTIFATVSSLDAANLLLASLLVSLCLVDVPAVRFVLDGFATPLLFSTPLSILRSPFPTTGRHTQYIVHCNTILIFTDL